MKKEDKANCGRIALVIVLAAVAAAACATGYNKFADDYYEQGQLFYERMEYERSVDSFSKVLELAPYGKENNKVYYSRGRAYLKSRAFDRAAYDFTKALELTAADDSAMRFLIFEMRGDALQGERKFDQAIQDYTVAVSLVPDHENIKVVYTNRGWAFLNKNDPDAAIRDFSQAIDIDRGFDPAYFGRAHGWLKKGDSAQALIDAKEALKLKPNMSDYDNFLYEVRAGVKKD
jgi:tetratricopeptide (TPR) repeat protein